ncbi:MAG: sigma-70 region 4 domain-containing protein [Saccharofermentans sp.]|nr:sigma-70 region 4 domain-containing protein [Saccharofermentans sp.]
MNTICNLFLDKEYKVIDLKKEYAGATGYVGEERYAVVTELAEKELLEKFGQKLNRFKPFVVISYEMYDAIVETKKNDKREQWRDCMLHDAFTTESLLILINAMSDPISICESALTLEYIASRMLELPNHQGSRMYKRYVLGYTVKEIALYEGVTERSVEKSLQIAKAKIHDVFVECGVVA